MWCNLFFKGFQKKAALYRPSNPQVPEIETHIRAIALARPDVSIGTSQTEHIRDIQTY
jgi:hypothetical protein